jgi:YgiT-type zinc finger domain-containing protein
MKCPICKHGETESGYATVILERQKTTLVFKRVPADVCNNCGEEFIGETISAKLFSIAKRALEIGVQVDVREYLEAA